MDDVDRAACAISGVMYDPQSYCGFYQWATIVGTSPRVQDDNGTVDPVKLRAYLAENFAGQLNAVDVERLVTFLCETYSFSCWVTVGR